MPHPNLTKGNSTISSGLFLLLSCLCSASGLTQEEYEKRTDELPYIFGGIFLFIFCMGCIIGVLPEIMAEPNAHEREAEERRTRGAQQQKTTDIQIWSTCPEHPVDIPASTQQHLESEESGPKPKQG